jgi:DNA-binding response OmpR family regulator
MAEEVPENGGPAANASEPRARSRRRRSGGPRMRIVLADDNSETREIVRRVLISRYDVESVGDGAAALDAIRRQKPDLVLTDATMPNIDGFALVRTLREDPCTARIPVLLVSARLGEETRAEAMRAGADDFLEKPFSSRELLACVTALLQKRPPPMPAPRAS